MLTGELRGQIDGIWNDFWSGGLAHPLRGIEQITRSRGRIGRTRMSSPRIGECCRTLDFKKEIPFR